MKTNKLYLGAVNLIAGVGEDPKREGLIETPERVAKAWAFWCSGYDDNPSDHMKSFVEQDSDEMVIVKDLPIYSKCEHHLADIFGTVTIGYIPNGRVLGLSKLHRIANVFARRLQVQERLTRQIADTLMTVGDLKPRGVGVQIKARHMCMESRGINVQGHHTVTNALLGVMRSDERARAEFLALAK